MVPKKITVNKALQLAKESIANNNVETAISLYRSILKQEPKQQEALKGLKALSKHRGASLQKPPIPKIKLDEIVNLYLAGNGDQAEKLCLQYLSRYAKTSELLNLLGASLISLNKFDKAIDTYNDTLELYPEFTEGYINRANAKQSLSKLEDALVDYNKAIELSPNHAVALNNRGNLFQNLNQHEKAIDDYEKALALNNNFADAYFNLGNSLKDLGEFTRAIDHYRKAVQVDPKYIAAHSNCAYCLRQVRDDAGAIEQYTLAIKIDSSLPINFCGRGEVYCEKGDYENAATDFNNAILIDPKFARAHNGLGKTLYHKGKLPSAITHLEKAIELEPNYAIAYNNLGVVLNESEDHEGALVAFNEVIRLTPELPEVYNNIGNLLRQLGSFSEAIDNFNKAIKLKFSYAEAFNNRGSSFQSLGLLSKAIDDYKQAISLTTFYPMAYSNLLTTLNYSQEKNLNSPIDLAREFGLQLTKSIKKTYSNRQEFNEDETLRIGFVSGDLRSHPVGYFLEGILPSFKSSNLKIFAYPTKSTFDDLSERIKPHFSGWHSIYGMDDETAAEIIVQDKIQILIDLSGHTAGNRLSLFGYRAAPVQASWLGYFATTGVSEIDYLIGDPYMTPPELDSEFTEEVIRLAETRWCFTPPDYKNKVSATPALKEGFITFGCFNNLTKINDTVLNVWSKILKAIPNSRLLLKNNQFRDEKNVKAVLEKLREFGVSGKQIAIEGPDQREIYLESYNKVDIALDPFPFTGGATSAEGLWMGVPLITLSGSSMVARQGVSILTNTGLQEWIANNEQEYIDKAISFSSDIKKLNKIRKGLRKKVLSSPLFDTARFSSNLENALTQLWQKYSNANKDL